jgi:hypothetical protein
MNLEGLDMVVALSSLFISCLAFAVLSITAIRVSELEQKCDKKEK